MSDDVWLFGYGSLIWRPDFEYRQKTVATIDGWARRFWQGSHDHRGVPDAPGRVVTLVPAAGSSCSGMAFRITAAQADEVFGRLDYREKNGYERHVVDCRLRPDTSTAGGAERIVKAIVYVASEENPAFLGADSVTAMLQTIRTAHGPSGSNRDYLLQLAAALRDLDLHDEHVFELESQL